MDHEEQAHYKFEIDVSVPQEIREPIISSFPELCSMSNNADAGNRCQLIHMKLSLSVLTN
jgi:hypothetical protein